MKNETRYILTKQQIIDLVSDEISENFENFSDHYITLGIVNSAIDRLKKKNLPHTTYNGPELAINLDQLHTEIKE